MIQQYDRELNEAIAAGRSALEVAERAKKRLDEARDFCKWELGNALFRLLCRSEALKKAGREVEFLQAQLQNFASMLEKMVAFRNMTVKFREVTDFTYNIFIVDQAQKERIEDSQVQVNEVIIQIESVLAQLESMRQ